MSLMNTIKNSLPATRQTIMNSIDRGVGALGVSLSSSTNNTNLKDLTDLTIVNKSIANARRAFEIDPTTRSSILSMLIIANGEWDIIGDKGADEGAVQHIKNKAREWELNQTINALFMKSMVDGKSFIQKRFLEHDITNIDFLAFDEQDYNFIELKHPITGKVIGYKQKAKIYPVPSTWKTDSFDSLANRQGETKESNFNPEQVIYPRLFDDGSSLVYGALDDIYHLKTIKNYGPTIIKRAIMTLGVEVGTKDHPFKPFDDLDDYETKKQKVNSELGKVAADFSKKEQKDTIVHSYGSKPYMIGDGKLVDITSFTDMYKQEIKEALLTPDSRFNSASTNKATASTQLGSMGQMTVITFLQDHARQYLEPRLFDDQLNRANHVDSIGLVHLKFTPLEIEDDLTLAQVVEKLEQYFPSLDDMDKELRIQTYFPRYYKNRQQFLADQEESPEDKTVITNSITDTGHGFIESQNGTNDLINNWKKFLIDEEIVKPAG